MRYYSYEFEFCTPCFKLVYQIKVSVRKNGDCPLCECSVTRNLNFSSSIWNFNQSNGQWKLCCFDQERNLFVTERSDLSLNLKGCGRIPPFTKFPANCESLLLAALLVISFSLLVFSRVIHYFSKIYTSWGSDKLS